MENAIITENLVKVYKGKGKNRGKKLKALVDLNLEVKMGDIFGFIGPNGAGKTTTLKILMGLIAPTKGSALVMGEPAGSVESKIKVGYLSEIAYYYPFMEVGNLLDFYCSFYEIPRWERKEKITKVLQLVRLADKFDSRISELSKGMKQRFGIAQAIIADPPLLILDELTSGLDPIAQKEVKDIILELKSRGKTIFFSSHQMTEVENICDKIGIIHKGKMLKCAELDDFLKEESGGLSKIIFETSDDKPASLLREKGLELDAVRESVYSVIVSDEKVNGILELILEGNGKVMEIKSHVFSLEDAFFSLIKGVE